jgi:hypothetical protein
LRAHFEQLRRINLPAILEMFHTSRNDTCFTALLRLEEDSAVVSFSPGDELRVPIEAIERFWARRAHVFWKDFEELGEVGPGDTRAETWVKKSLAKLDYLTGEVEPVEDAMRAGIAQFQSSAFLVADGVAGPRTRMALYSLSGLYTMPRLSEP